ncbi:hypothetical protein [Actinokineospora sp. NBRC 105648]|uniref:hypothetical protein n=1 Tax=Actinokineospora sp. NBRC 105648 TaxID=3032206 RepID=UPI00249FF040|nr:hypothetical protein [Actinokineospora sp. NBRC 105648]GLZ37953.1 hypothetical protein Acsp05_15770 [Actinokineospora sp. NBRC 105648]
MKIDLARLLRLRGLKGLFVEANTDDPNTERHVVATIRGWGGRRTGSYVLDRTLQKAGTTVAIESTSGTTADTDSPIAKVDVAIKSVTDQRSNLGAFSHRLETAIRSTDDPVENLASPDGGSTGTGA